MTKMTPMVKLRNKWRKLRRAEDGSTAITFALALIPLVALTGAAVDYSRASAIRTAMQTAVDSTALAISKNVSSQTAGQLNSSATSYFNALFTRTDAQNIKVTATYTNSGETSVIVNASGSMKTDFMGIMGFQDLPIAVTSTVKWGTSRLRVALALDNTGSMASSGKMNALKTATKKLLTQLKDAAQNNGDVYVSIIPFAKDVNAGKSNYAANWIDWSDWDSQNGSWQGGGGGGKGKKTKTWVPANHKTWNGCITDRDMDYDVKNTTPASGTPATLFPAEQNNDCPVELMPLSYDWNALNSKINTMKPDGWTNITIGLGWAWQSLTQGAPLFAPAEDPNYQYQKVIILLTDGENTQNRFTSNQSAIDARTKMACDNAKAAGITIYTVLVMQGTKSLLQQCATDPSKFFFLTSANQLVAAFEQIGTAISKLRIAK